MLNEDSFSLNDCQLKPHRVDIWHFSLLAEPADALEILSNDEQARAARFYFPHHQRRYMNAHRYLRLILGHYLKTPPGQLEFTNDTFGKPRLAHHHIEFNLSHSGESALVAVGQIYPLGVDLEYFSPRPYQGIGQHLFSNKENEFLDRVPQLLLPLAFFNIWTQKEAFIKACGLGLRYPTKSFDVPFFSTQPQIIEDTLHQKTWKIRSFSPSIGCCAALCYDLGITEVRYLSLFEEQMECLCG